MVKSGEFGEAVTSEEDVEVSPENVKEEEILPRGV